MATFLARARQLQPVAAGPFSDTAGDQHEQNINAVAAAGIAGGFGDGTYRPLAGVLRDQMATFLFRAFLPASELASVGREPDDRQRRERRGAATRLAVPRHGGVGLGHAALERLDAAPPPPGVVGVEHDPPAALGHAEAPAVAGHRREVGGGTTGASPSPPRRTNA